ncbi:hypothetical protein [Aerococcus christensenii]|uniref:hypothetical protein n=1 Tax=Aerococcus christensenii TaxID=87541 RepID=UPI003F43E53C
MKQFYKDLSDWVEKVNQKSKELNEKDYWQFVLTSIGELSDKYSNNQLVVRILLVHLEFLEEMSKQNK